MTTSIREKKPGAAGAGSNRMARLVILVLLFVAVVGLTASFSTSGGTILTHNLQEPLNGATVAKFDVDARDGNLTINSLPRGKQLLASGTLQYLDGEGVPVRTVSTEGGQTTLALRGAGEGQPWFSFPWEACNGATDWLVQLNPDVRSEITAHSDGGNLALDLAGMTVTRVAADTGGGNVDLVLPDDGSTTSVTASTGAGNVGVLVPSGVAARIKATSGLGEVTVDPRFAKVGDDTYQSPDFGDAVRRVDITAISGAGNVTVNSK